MFSGLVETTGIIEQLAAEKNCLHMKIAPQQLLTKLKIGESIAVNGTCLTITQIVHSLFSVTIVPETRRLTNLDRLTQGSIVNLERACRLGDRLHGHYVQGHVDGMGEIIDLQSTASVNHQPAEHSLATMMVKITVPASLANYIVKKGYLTVDGMSLTVIDITKHWFTVTLIPHTQAVTIAKYYRLGTVVNLEGDVIAKYIAKHFETANNQELSHAY